MSLVMGLRTGSSSCVAAIGGISAPIEIYVGMHQGSQLSTLLFNLIMKETTNKCRRGVPWDILYADDLVLTAKTREEMPQFFRWKAAM